MEWIEKRKNQLIEAIERAEAEKNFSEAETYLKELRDLQELEKQTLLGEA